MDDAGIREALRRLDEAYRRGLERLNRTQELITLSQHALRGRRSTRRSAWQTVAPAEEDDTPDAGSRHQEARDHGDSASPDRHSRPQAKGATDSPLPPPDSATARSVRQRVRRPTQSP